MREREMQRASDRATRRETRHILTKAVRCVIELLEARYLLSSVVSTFPIPGSDADNYYGSGKIVAGRDGTYWFADTSDDAIGRITAQGQVRLFPVPLHRVPADDGTNAMVSDDPEPLDVVLGPNGNIWFTESTVDRIGEINPRGKITEFQTPSPDSYPEGLAVGSDGNLWFAETGNDAIGKITPTGGITEYIFDDLHMDYDGLVEGSDGNIWFLADDGNDRSAIASITPDGVVNSYSLEIPQSDGSMVNPDLTALTAGPDGNLWIATASQGIEQMTTAGALTTFAIPSNDSVTSIEAGSGGKLWLALTGNDQFGFITTAGAVSTFSLPETDAYSDNADISMSDLIEGPDGSLWFVDSDTPQAGTIDLSSAPLASGNTVKVSAASPQTSTLGSFYDFSGSSDASDYTATITLDDGTTVPGTVAANDSGGFDVIATNTWTIGSDDNVSISITDARDPSRVATALASVNATVPQAIGSGINVTATAFDAFSGNVATFTGVMLNSLSTYSAIISWGDGISSTGTITANATGGIDISGGHSYGFGGTYSIVTVLSTGGSVNSTATSSATIAARVLPPVQPIDPIFGTGIPIQAVTDPILQLVGIPVTFGGISYLVTNTDYPTPSFVISSTGAGAVVPGVVYGELLTSSVSVGNTSNMDAMVDSTSGGVQNAAFAVNSKGGLISGAKSIRRGGTAISTVTQAVSHSVSVAKVKSSGPTVRIRVGVTVSRITDDLSGIYFIPSASDPPTVGADPISDEQTLFSGPIAAFSGAPSDPTPNGNALIVTGGQIHRKAGMYTSRPYTTAKVTAKPTAQVADVVEPLSASSVLS